MYIVTWCSYSPCAIICAGARPASHNIILNFDKRAEFSLIDYSYSINYIALQILLWLAALYTSSRLVFQVALSLLLAI